MPWKKYNSTKALDDLVKVRGSSNVGRLLSALAEYLSCQCSVEVENKHGVAFESPL